MSARRFPSFVLALMSAVLALGSGPAFAAQTQVAVASNFAEPAKQIATAFKAATGHEAVLSFGSSGQFYTQISKGAPFEVFLSADAERPQKAEADGYAVAGSRFTYAIGKLVLWSKTPGLVKGEETLKAASFAKLSICNPAAAPYGAAAVEAMKAGAVDFIEKPFADEILLAAIQMAAAQGSRMGRADGESAQVRARLATLSPRERDVLNGLLAGHPNKTIAYDLGLSPRTVEVHRANVMTKMAAASLSELVRMTLQCGNA